ncbi:unnamed protein product [Bursaphelenchus xylophilus]|uniref:(pine wood nematode) hypothetical protein n=1 Tax=Bursaphelenchus xylophilus TaxID=6326 RepID=A0A1I7S824_BURXY|nr:unnamed protein product [Bursaphelenchus xylophilus]CAG9080664.1 unnamed protein product [Bursaphelenchus xylophilus]
MFIPVLLLFLVVCASAFVEQWDPRTRMSQEWRKQAERDFNLGNLHTEPYLYKFIWFEIHHGTAGNNRSISHTIRMNGKLGPVNCRRDNMKCSSPINTVSKLMNLGIEYESTTLNAVNGQVHLRSYSVWKDMNTW